MVDRVKNPDVHFPGQHKKEQVKVVYRRHIFFLIIGYLYTLVMSGVALWLYFYLPSVVPFLGSGLAAQVYDLVLLFVILFIFYTIFLTWTHYYLDAYIVSNERLLSIDQVDFFHREVSEADIGNVQDIEVTVKGFFATLIGFGDVRVQTAGADPRTLFLNDITDPYEAKNLILKLSEKNRKRELHDAYTYRPKTTPDA